VIAEHLVVFVPVEIGMSTLQFTYVMALLVQFTVTQEIPELKLKIKWHIFNVPRYVSYMPL